MQERPRRITKLAMKTLIRRRIMMKMVTTNGGVTNEALVKQS